MASDDCSDLVGAVAKKSGRYGPRTFRPQEFSQKLADDICERLADGESLRSICEDKSMPTRATVFRWLAASPAFQSQYAHAREDQTETLVDEMLRIADDKSLDPKDRRVRIDTRKWLAGKMKPKKYGDKTVLSNDPENPLPDAGVKIDVVALAEQLRNQAALGKTDK